MLNELALARAVEGALKATFNSTDGLVHLISLRGGIDPGLFATYWPGWRLAKPACAQYHRRPDDTVTMVYPRTGNERAGLVLPTTRALSTVTLARERHHAILARPVWSWCGVAAR